jgi:hypothetical protein
VPYAVPIYNLGNPTWIRAVADDGTPAELQLYANRYLAVREESDLPPTGLPGIVIVNGTSVPGYLRNKDGEWQWVITPQQDPMQALVIGLPGPSGWASQAAGTTWYNVGVALRGAGGNGNEIATAFEQLFNAARTEVMAELAQQQGGQAAKGGAA